jgi:hypothetical protein
MTDFSDVYMRLLRRIYEDDFGTDQINAYDRWVRAEALREAADDLEAAGGDYYSAQTEAWLRARADAEEGK